MAAAADESEDLHGAGGGAGGAVSLSEWQAWGTVSPVPAMVSEVIEGLTALKNDTDAPMTFGGIGGKLQGNFKVQEDKKQRHMYKSLTDSEEKLRFFSARQIACRLLGSRGYLCQKCWIAAEDCMCSKLVPVSLWHGIRFWVYMHPKDFLRQNNTGKLLWQLFGVKAASLCLFGIPEHEDIMWDAFKYSGKNMVWFLYPNKTLTPHSVQDVFVDRSFTISEGQIVDLGEKPLNFVLIDGTWSNSAAMYRRLKSCQPFQLLTRLGAWIDEVIASIRIDGHQNGEMKIHLVSLCQLRAYLPCTSYGPSQRGIAPVQQQQLLVCFQSYTFIQSLICMTWINRPSQLRKH